MSNLVKYLKLLSTFSSEEEFKDFIYPILGKNSVNFLSRRHHLHLCRKSCVFIDFSDFIKKQCMFSCFNFTSYLRIAISTSEIGIIAL